MGLAPSKDQQNHWIQYNELSHIPGTPLLLALQYDLTLQAEKYRFSYNLNEQLEEYNNRKNELKNVVGVYEFKKNIDASPCVSLLSYFIVITERIPFRLSDLQSITRQQGFYILKNALIGFRLLHQQGKTCYIKSSMIGIKNNGEIKVWINQIFGLNQPSQPISRQDRMLDQIINVIQDHIQKKQQTGFGINFHIKKSQIKINFKSILNLIQSFSINYINSKQKLIKRLKWLAEKKAGLRKNFSEGNIQENRNKLINHQNGFKNQSNQFKKYYQPIIYQNQIPVYKQHFQIQNFNKQKNIQRQSTSYSSLDRPKSGTNINHSSQHRIYHSSAHQHQNCFPITQFSQTNEPMNLPSKYKNQIPNKINNLRFKNQHKPQTRIRYSPYPINDINVNKKKIESHQNFIKSKLKSRQTILNNQSIQLTTKKGINPRMIKKNQFFQKNLEQTQYNKNRIQRVLSLMNSPQENSSAMSPSTIDQDLQQTQKYTNIFKYYLQSYDQISQEEEKKNQQYQQRIQTENNHKKNENQLEIISQRSQRQGEYY